MRQYDTHTTRKSVAEWKQFSKGNGTGSVATFLDDLCYALIDEQPGRQSEDLSRSEVGRASRSVEAARYMLRAR